MKFIHIADVHLGASPDAGSAYTKNRGAELWNSFEHVIHVCEKEQTDLLLIAGDLFHRQPLLRELKEVDYLFSELTHTKVVLIAGNHDYIKPTSYYKTFEWSDNVFPLFDEKLRYIRFPELHTCIYGLSYWKKEIQERLYDEAVAEGKEKIEILLVHGGDEKHIPFGRNRLVNTKFNYIACGHIHKPMELERNKMYYSGALEPVDKNDTGAHGYIKGEIKDGKTEAVFVPAAMREYIHMEVAVDAHMTSRGVKDKVASEILKNGVDNIYKVALTGYCDPDMMYDLGSMDVYGNILEIADFTNPAYDFEKLVQQNRDNLLGQYIEKLKGSMEGSVEYQALFEGVKALLETKRG